MYLRLAVQNTCGVKMTKLANMLEEMEVFVKNWEGSIPQPVAIATVEASKIAFHLRLLTTYEVSFRISFNISEPVGKMIFPDISSAFTFADVTSYYLHLHIEMAASISQVPPL